MVITLSKSMQRQFSHTRFIFLLIIVLNTLDNKNHNNRSQFMLRKHFERDLNYCHKCFETQIQHCVKFFKQIQADEELSMKQLLNLLPFKSGKRSNQVVKFKYSTEKVIAKYFLYQKMEQYENCFNKKQLKTEFLRQQENLQGMQYAPLQTLQAFIKNLQTFHRQLPEVAIWHYLLHNIQPLIFPLLQQQNFPVPKTYGMCGFTLYQHYAGQDLYHFFKLNFKIKLEIAKQLLQAAIKFSHGFLNYRLYITDLTADNLVYNGFENKLYFIDLDTIFIVDSTQAKYQSNIHKHQPIECSGCFAYSADEIAVYNISDINIYSACQFLKEDLFKDQTKGFLYPLPPVVLRTYPQLWQLLNKCVDCPEILCEERFTVAEDLIKLFQEILMN